MSDQQVVSLTKMSIEELEEKLLVLQGKKEKNYGMAVRS